MVPFTMTLSDFKVTGVTIDALDVLSAQLTHDLFAIATFLLRIYSSDHCDLIQQVALLSQRGCAMLRVCQ